jgi:hypothetical protein
MSASLALELLDAALQCEPSMIKRTPQLLQVLVRDALLIVCALTRGL